MKQRRVTTHRNAGGQNKTRICFQSQQHSVMQKKLVPSLLNYTCAWPGLQEDEAAEKGPERAPGQTAFPPLSGEVVDQCTLHLCFSSTCHATPIFRA